MVASANLTTSNSRMTNYSEIQVTACTGQPMLANNVTQAQAFCIATACLQVPVISKSTIDSDLFRVAGINDHHMSHQQSSNKLNLFRPNLFKGLYSKPQQQQLIESPFYYPQRGFKPIKGNSGRFKKSLEPRNYSGTIEFAPKGFGSALETSAQSSVPVATVVPPDTSGSSPAATTEPITVTTAATIITTTTNSTSTTSESSEDPTMATEESRSIEYPNFNQMYSRIYNSMAEQKQPLLWRPSEYHQPVVGLQQQHKVKLTQLRTTANRMASLMHSVSHNLALKKANFVSAINQAPLARTYTKWWPPSPQRVPINRFALRDPYSSTSLAMLDNSFY